MIIILPCGYSITHAGLVFLVMAIPSFYVAPVLGLVGSCLAVVGLLRKNRRRGVSIAGLILNVITFLAYGLLWLGVMWIMQGVGAG